VSIAVSAPSKLNKADYLFPQFDQISPMLFWDQLFLLLLQQSAD